MQTKKTLGDSRSTFLLLEVPGGFEPPFTVLQTVD